MEVFGSNTSGESLLKELEKLVQNSLKNLVENSSQKPQFIGLQKLAVGSQGGLSVDRPVDRSSNGLKYDRWPADRTVDRQATLAPNG